MRKRRRDHFKRLREQEKVDKNTFQETKTTFSSVNITPKESTNRKPSKVALCQLDFDYKKLLNEPHKHPNDHIDKIIKAVDDCAKEKVGVLYFPELCFPEIDTTEFIKIKKRVNETGISTIFGSIKKASKKHEKLTQIWIDRQKVVSRRLLYISSRLHEIENQEGLIVERLGQSSARLQRIVNRDLKSEVRIHEFEPQYFYSVKSILSNEKSKCFAKSVCHIEELEGNITPGADYAILQSPAGSSLLASGGEFLGKYSYVFEGEFNLIEKILNYTARNNVSAADFYRISVEDIHPYRAGESPISLLSILSYEIGQNAFPNTAEEMLEKVPTLLGIFYVNHAQSGNTSLVLRKTDNIEFVKELDNIEVPKETSDNSIRFFIPESKEGILIADISEQGKKLSLNDVYLINL